MDNREKELISVYKDYEICTKLRDDFVDYLDLLIDARKNYDLKINTKERQQDLILSLKWVPLFLLLMADAVEGISPTIYIKLDKDVRKLFKLINKTSKIVPFDYKLSEAVIHKSFVNARPTHLLRINVENCHFYATSFSQSLKELKINSKNLDKRWNELFTVNLDGSRKSKIKSKKRSTPKKLEKKTRPTKKKKSSKKNIKKR